MSMALDKFANSGTITGGEAKSGVDAGITNNNFTRNFGNVGGFNVDISWWLIAAVVFLLVVFLWLKRKK